MKEEDFEIAIKVVIVGNGAVGKSSMIQRYCKGIFTRDYKKTIGVDFLERQIVWVLLCYFLSLVIRQIVKSWIFLTHVKTLKIAVLCKKMIW